MKRLLLALALVASAVSYGEPKTYNGADNGDWFADGNWYPSGVPTSSSMGVIPRRICYNTPR